MIDPQLFLFSDIPPLGRIVGRTVTIIFVLTIINFSFNVNQMVKAISFVFRYLKKFDTSNYNNDFLINFPKTK